jgi:YHS domain-containing protein
MVRDLVCGREMNETKVGASCDYEGQIYYFCGETCKDQFANVFSPQMNLRRARGESDSTFRDD